MVCCLLWHAVTVDGLLSSMTCCGCGWSVVFLVMLWLRMVYCLLWHVVAVDGLLSSMTCCGCEWSVVFYVMLWLWMVCCLLGHVVTADGLLSSMTFCGCGWSFSFCDMLWLWMVCCLLWHAVAVDALYHSVTCCGCGWSVVCYDFYLLVHWSFWQNMKCNYSLFGRKKISIYLSVIIMTRLPTEIHDKNIQLQLYLGSCNKATADTHVFTIHLITTIAWQLYLWSRSHKSLYVQP